ncbi:hypothetical protein Q9189_004367 [Teloschistes chrysophthalmus]
MSSLRAEKLGFMDLPPEVRLLIYPHLLTSTRTETHYAPNTDRQHNRRSGPTPIIIEPSLSSPGSVTHYRDTEANSKADDEGFADFDEKLEPAILRTCRTIYREAAAIIYTTNTFAFRATPARPSSRGDDLMFWDEPAAVTDGEIPFYGQSALTTPPTSAPSSSAPRTPPPPLPTSSPPYLSPSPGSPNLKYLQLHVEAKYVDWDDPFAPDPNNDDEMANGPLEPMYAALLRFIRRVHWLEGFRYEDTIGQWQFAEEDALETLKGLEWIVEEKSWTDLEKIETRRWMKTEGHWRVRALEEDMEAGWSDFWRLVDA